MGGTLVDQVFPILTFADPDQRAGRAQCGRSWNTPAVMLLALFTAGTQHKSATAGGGVGYN